jgi:formate dehydrogenase subunit gamma
VAGAAAAGGAGGVAAGAGGVAGAGVGLGVAAAVIAGAGLVLFGTGLLLIAPVRLDLPDGMREGATVVHDLFTFELLALLAGHIWMALRHPEARRALRTGRVDRGYAEREHPAWAAEAAGSRTVPHGKGPDHG